MTETTIAPIDGQTAYDLLAAAVELTGPNHTVERCQYTTEGGDNPCCMVGVALAVHGVPLDVLRGWDIEGVDNDGDGVISRAAGMFPWLDDDAVRVLSAAQRVQDDGATWGAALSKARSTLADLNR